MGENDRVEHDPGSPQAGHRTLDFTTGHRQSRSIDLLTLIWKGIRILSGLTGNRPTGDHKEDK
ncbi:MAG TPA: hypothetical protein DCM45_00860 [Clostridiales bacterium]|nr:hypothetical protein [Clostridiales bacterium]